jgi:hypothetical protein
VLVMGASVPVTVVINGLIVAIVGESAPVRVVMTGATVLVTGASAPMAVGMSGATALVTGTSAVTVDMTGVAVLVTALSELVTVLTTGVIVLMTGADAPTVAVEPEGAAPVTGERVWVAVLTTWLTVSVIGAAARVGVNTTGVTPPAAATGDAVLATVTVFMAVARVRSAATEASTPVVLAASEVGAWAAVAPGALPEVAVEAAKVTGDAVVAGTAGVVRAELTAPDAGLAEPLPGAEAPEPVESTEGLGAPAALEATGEAAGVTSAAAELTVEMTGAAELTAEVTGDAAELTVEVTAERGDGGGDVSEAAACACRENTSMITKIPAATIASCTARKATRRTIGCGMSSSPSPGRGRRAPVTGVLEPRSPRPSQGDSPNLTCCSVNTVQCDNSSEQYVHRKWSNHGMS